MNSALENWQGAPVRQRSVLWHRNNKLVANAIFIINEVLPNYTSQSVGLHKNEKNSLRS